MEFEDDKEFAFMMLLHLKITAFISKNLYDSKVQYSDVLLDKYSDILYQGCLIEEEADYIAESKLTCGYLPDYVLTYFVKSPHWEVMMCSLYVEYYDDHVEKEEGGNGYKVGEAYVRKIAGDFFEEKVYKNKESLEKITSYFCVDADFTDDLCIIKSSLWPYVEEFERRAGRDYPEEIDYLKKAYDTIGSWLCGIDEFFQTSGNGYFLSSDDSGGAYGYDMGCLLHNRSMLVAAELVEKIMFSLDEIYHILPEEILREEELWIRKREQSLNI